MDEVDSEAVVVVVAVVDVTTGAILADLLSRASFTVALVKCGSAFLKSSEHQRTCRSVYLPHHGQISVSIDTWFLGGTGSLDQLCADWYPADAPFGSQRDS